jgi:hypothetical protein
VRPSTAPRWVGALADAGLLHALDSAEFRNERRLFNLTASRWELIELPAVPAPFPERVLSSVVEAPFGLLELHNAHVPPAQSRGFVKVETCEAIHDRLARPSDRPRILCGDLNTPQRETQDGEVITFAENHPQWLERWDAAERSVVEGLAEWGMVDVFRLLHGYERQDVSWVFHTRAVPPRRLSPRPCDRLARASTGLVRLPARMARGRALRPLGDRGDIRARERRVDAPAPDRRARGGTDG